MWREVTTSQRETTQSSRLLSRTSPPLPARASSPGRMTRSCPVWSANTVSSELPGPARDSDPAVPVCALAASVSGPSAPPCFELTCPFARRASTSARDLKRKRGRGACCCCPSSISLRTETSVCRKGREVGSRVGADDVMADGSETEGAQGERGAAPPGLAWRRRPEESASRPTARAPCPCTRFLTATAPSRGTRGSPGRRCAGERLRGKRVNRGAVGGAPIAPGGNVPSAFR